MAPRSSWKGFIQLSLVSVPVKAYTASASGREIRLNQLHADCHNRVKYEKTCPEHGPLASGDIVSGYEYDKGRYVVIESDELAKVRQTSDRSIGILGFIDKEQIDPMNFSGRTLVLIPDGPVGQKPYALFRQTMEEDGLMALSKMVLSGREQLVCLRPLDGVIVASVLTYAERLKSPSGFADELVDAEISQEELKLTRTLVAASKIEELDLTQYRDPYTAELTQIIEAKVAGEEIVSVPDPEEPKVIHLMEALKQSIANAQEAEIAQPKKKTKKKAATKKAATSKKTAKKKATKKKMAPSKKPAKKKKSG